MKLLYRIQLRLSVLVSFSSFSLVSIAQLPSAEETLVLINKVNSSFQAANKPNVRAFWDHAAYHTGNMAAYEVTRNEAFRNYSEAWAEHNKWMGARSADPTKWKLSYGETDDFVLFGDWQACFQTYLDLYQLKPEAYKIARTREVMDYQLSTSRNDYWWWADGLYMVMPVMTKLYRVTGDRTYLGKLYEYFSYANSIMYDESTGLYFRDAKYVYPAHKTLSGKKDFWARGDGWVFAALAKVLTDLPADDPHRKEYVSRFRKMAKTLKKAQQPDGYWTRSMLDPAHAPGPETSGTAFYTFGYLWGVNNGILKRNTYLKTIKRSWNYLTTIALQPDGKIGYIQPIGEKAIPGQVVNAASTADFGTGAFLLASAEMYRFTKKAEHDIK